MCTGVFLQKLNNTPQKHIHQSHEWIITLKTTQRQRTNCPYFIVYCSRLLAATAADKHSELCEAWTAADKKQQMNINLICQLKKQKKAELHMEEIGQYYVHVTSLSRFSKLKQSRAPLSSCRLTRHGNATLQEWNRAASLPEANQALIWNSEFSFFCS